MALDDLLSKMHEKRADIHKKDGYLRGYIKSKQEAKCGYKVRVEKCSE